MLTKCIMKRMGWSDVWMPNDGFIVGVWTGPQNDLLCVKRCVTTLEANEYLAPKAASIVGACLKSLRLLVQRDGFDATAHIARRTPLDWISEGMQHNKVSEQEWQAALTHLEANLSPEAILAFQHGGVRLWGQLDLRQAEQIVDSIRENVNRCERSC